MPSYDLIRQAIIDKACITCFYNGYLRKLSPHAIGTKNGKRQGLFYQYGGESSSGLSYDESKNWRCIPIDTMQNIEINGDVFATASNHSRAQSCVDMIDVEIDF
jgi:hypothetical protein